MPETKTAEQTINVVIVLQHENWEDDGGDHDPALVSVTPKQFAELQAIDTGQAAPDVVVLRDIVSDAPTPTLPCTIHGVFNIWHNF